jgi:NodT family efflux transporter outer membrane factor (OMF) lipoprotein
MSAAPYQERPSRNPLSALVYGAVLALAGCMSVPDIHPKAQSREPNKLEAGKMITSAQTIEWPHEDWWTAYRDPQLNTLMETALKDSPTLHMAEARVELTKAYAAGMHAEMMPDISGEASITRERFTALQFIPPPWAGNVDWNNRAAVSMAYDLDLWGRQEHLWKGSVGETQATAAEAQQVKLEIVTAIVRSYVRLSMEYALRDIAEERMAEVEKRVSIAKRGLKAGLGTGMQVSEAETALPMARAHIESIDAHIALTKNQLAALAGQGPGAGERLQRPSIKLEAAIGLPDTLPANLVGRRPDILAHRWHVEAAGENIESAKAAYYPNINLLAFVGFQALGFGQLLSSAAAIGGVGPAISLPLFDGGRRKSQLTGRTAAYDMAVEQYNAVLVQALQDVSDQLVILQSNEKQRKDAEQALALAEKAHRLSKQSHQAGLDNFQHVLDTEATVLRQREVMVQLEAERQETHAGLMRALGGGVTEALMQAESKKESKP